MHDQRKSSQHVILSEAKDLGVRTVEILRCAQDDDPGELSNALTHNVVVPRKTTAK